MAAPVCLRGVLWILLVPYLLLAESAQMSPDTNLKVPIPESAFISPQQYTNAFFGFNMPLPRGHHFEIQDLSLSENALQHFLFAEKSFDKGLTTLIISANQVLGSADDEAQRTALIPGTRATQENEALNLGGRLFWKSEIEQKTYAGKIWRVRYTTAAPGFVLQFSISSQNQTMVEDLQQCLRSIKFFDPTKAREMAGSDSHPFLPQAARMRMASLPQLDIEHLSAGEVSGNIYVNRSLGFAFQFPAGWSVQERNVLKKTPGLEHPARFSDASTQPQAATEQCMRILFSASKFASDAQGQKFNPRIMIVAADPSCFAPDLKFPASVHDQQSLELLGQAVIRAFAGSPLLGHDARTIRAIDLAEHIFVEFPNSAAVPVRGSSLFRRVHRTLVMTSMRQYWVMWIFESDTESELTNMMKAALSFEPEVAPGVPGSH